MQRSPIKIGGSGGGWKSRSTGVDGCSNGVTVGEIALPVFDYSIIIASLVREPIFHPSRSSVVLRERINFSSSKTSGA